MAFDRFPFYSVNVSSEPKLLVSGVKVICSGESSSFLFHT